MNVTSDIATRLLARGIAMTGLGFGASQLGNLNRVTTDEESTAAVAAAWDAGIRYFDTAPHYGVGLSEARLGRALRDRDRDEYVLSTKVGRLLVPSPETADAMDTEGFLVPADPRRVWDFSRDGILRSVEASLGRLGIDRIDIAYLHDPDEHWDAASTTGMSALVELRDEGVVRAIGAGMNQADMLAEFVRRCDVDVVMVASRYTLLDQSAATELLPLAKERGVSVVAAGVYNSGLLSAAEVAPNARYDYEEAPPHIVDRARAIAAVCSRFGITLPDAAVRFPLLRPEIVSVVLGTRTASQVASGVERYRREIPAEFWNALVEEGVLP